MSLFLHCQVLFSDLHADLTDTGFRGLDAALDNLAHFAKLVKK